MTTEVQEAVIAAEAEAVATGTTDEVTSNGTDKKLAPKNKKIRGIGADMRTTYVPLDLTLEHSKIVHNAAKFKELKLSEYLAPFLHQAIADNWGEIKATAESYEHAAPNRTTTKAVKAIEEMSVEEADKYIEVMEQKMKVLQDRAKQAAEKARQLVAAKRAEAAAKSG